MVTVTDKKVMKFQRTKCLFDLASASCCAKIAASKSGAVVFSYVLRRKSPILSEVITPVGFGSSLEGLDDLRGVRPPDNKFLMKESDGSRLCVVVDFFESDTGFRSESEADFLVSPTNACN